MEVAEGEEVQRIVMTVYGKECDVIPLKYAAINAGYSTRHMRTLCDTGELIAIKYVGRWWVPIKEIKRIAAKD